MKGWLRVQAYATDPQVLLKSRDWRLEPAERLPTGKPQPLPSESLSIREVRPHGDGLVAKADGIEDRTAAEKFAGARIFVERARFPSPGRDEYYWADLVGCTVLNQDGASLGTVSGLLDNGVQSILRVASGDDAPERLIPFVDAYVGEVDLAARTIRVEWGLDY